MPTTTFTEATQCTSIPELNTFLRSQPNLEEVDREYHVKRIFSELLNLPFTSNEVVINVFCSAHNIRLTYTPTGFARPIIEIQAWLKVHGQVEVFDICWASQGNPSYECSSSNAALAFSKALVFAAHHHQALCELTEKEWESLGIDFIGFKL